MLADLVHQMRWKAGGMHLCLADLLQGEQVVQRAVVDPPALIVLHVRPKHGVRLAGARLAVCKNAHVVACRGVNSSSLSYDSLPTTSGNTKNQELHILLAGCKRYTDDTLSRLKICSCRMWV